LGGTVGGGGGGGSGRYKVGQHGGCGDHVRFAQHLMIQGGVDA